MKIEIVSQKENPLLIRTEVQFRVNHDEVGSTPPRLEIRSAVADALKKSVDLVFVKRFVTRTGTSVALGVANVYGSAEQAKLIEPDYIVKRMVPPVEKAEEGKKEEAVKPPAPAPPATPTAEAARPKAEAKEEKK
jgi:small subunit ribosomal protein S24e